MKSVSDRRPKVEYVRTFIFVLATSIRSENSLAASLFAMSFNHRHLVSTLKNEKFKKVGVAGLIGGS
jgi:hypothetical protein